MCDHCPWSNNATPQLVGNSYHQGQYAGLQDLLELDVGSSIPSITTAGSSDDPAEEDNSKKLRSIKTSRRLAGFNMRRYETL
ncbi:hypothetical protein ACLKA7_015248 [Drosophila subpalustris]